MTFVHHSFQLFGFALLKFLCLKQDLLTFLRCAISSSHNSNLLKWRSHIVLMCLMKTLLRSNITVNVLELHKLCGTYLTSYTYQVFGTTMIRLLKRTVWSHTLNQITFFGLFIVCFNSKTKYNRKSLRIFRI